MKEDVLSRMCSQQNNGRNVGNSGGPKCEGRHLCDRNPGISQAAVLQEFLRELLAGVIRLLGGGFKYFLFSHLFGEDSHFD